MAEDRAKLPRIEERGRMIEDRVTVTEDRGKCRSRISRNNDQGSRKLTEDRGTMIEER